MKSWTEWSSVHKSEPTHFYLDGTAVDMKTQSHGPGATLCICITSAHQPNVTAPQTTDLEPSFSPNGVGSSSVRHTTIEIAREASADAKTVAESKLDPSACGNATLKSLTFVVEKISSIRNLLDKASQVCFVCICTLHRTEINRNYRSTQLLVSLGRLSRRS